MEERYHATTQNRFYPDMSNVNKNITVEAKLISPPTHFLRYLYYNITLSMTKCFDPRRIVLREATTNNSALN